MEDVLIIALWLFLTVVAFSLVKREKGGWMEYLSAAILSALTLLGLIFI